MALSTVRTNVFRDPDMLHGPVAEIYMCVCQPLCGCRALVFPYQYSTICLSAPSLASRLLTQEKNSLLSSKFFRCDYQSLLKMGVLASLFGSSRVRAPVPRLFHSSEFFRVCVPDCIDTLHCRRQLILEERKNIYRYILCKRYNSGWAHHMNDISHTKKHKWNLSCCTNAGCWSFDTSQYYIWLVSRSKQTTIR